MKKIFYTSLLLFCFFINPGLSQHKRNLTVDDLFSLKDVSDPQLSPDGQWVAYLVRSLNPEKDKSFSHIHMIPFDGGDPIQLTYGESRNTDPRWSPDNKYLAFLSDRTKKTQVYLLNRNGGEAFQLTDVKQGVSDFEWSPDGKKLALVLRDPDPDEIEEPKKKDDEEKTPKPIVLTRLQFKFDEYGYLKELYDHIYAFDIESKTTRQLTFGPYDDSTPLWSSYGSTPRWSPDGKQILFVSNRTENPDGNRNTDLFLVSLDSGEVKKLTDNPGTDEAPRWSPDGKFIVYQTTVQPELMWYDTTKIAVIPASGGTPRILTRELDRNAYAPQFGLNGDTVYFILEDSGTERLAGIPAKGGRVNRNIAGENVVHDYDLGKNGAAVFLASRPDLPHEVFNLVQGKSKQITKTNARALESIQLGIVERVRFKSKDGTLVEGFVTKPPLFDDAKKYPLILWIHGGPTAQYNEEFEFDAQLFAAHGFVVLRVNPRGSTGYGEEFCKAIWADWGNKDYDDVMAGVDYLISQGYVDSERLGVGGWSYGGILTNYVITQTKRFKAASSGASEANYLADYGTDHYQFEWEKEIGLPWEKTELYLKLSPFFRLNHVVTPTLVLCGQEDWNVPLLNSEQLYQALKRLGVDTMLVVYPGQSHGIRTPSYQKDRYLRYLAWYGHYLQGTPAKIPQ